MKKSVEHIGSTDIQLLRRLDASEGWVHTENELLKAQDYDKIVYLGECEGDGQLFACYSEKVIDICGGYLNGGTY